jgi:hypothetical protein
LNANLGHEEKVAMAEERSAPLVRYEAPLLDVTDKSLYSFNRRSVLTKLSESSGAMAFDRLIRTTSSDTLEATASKIPALLKVLESMEGHKDLVVKLSAEAREKLASGEWSWLFAKDGSGILPTLRDESKHWAEQVRLEEVIRHPELLDSLVNVAQSNTLAVLAEQINQLSDAVEHIAAGQHLDRIARFYAARQLYIEAMSMTDPAHRRAALLHAAQVATEAAAALEQELKYELSSLATTKGVKQLDRSTQRIADGFSHLNDTIQLSIFAYSALGEQHALLASIRSYQCFIEDTLLSVPDGMRLTAYKGATLAEILYSSSQRSDVDWRAVPVRVVETCEEIIGTEQEVKLALSSTPTLQQDEQVNDEEL